MLADKKVLLTGASRGIGAAVARRLAAQRADVIVNHARNADAALRLVESIIANSGSASAIQADIAAPAENARLFDQVAERTGCDTRGSVEAASTAYVDMSRSCSTKAVMYESKLTVPFRIVRHVE